MTARRETAARRPLLRWLVIGFGLFWLLLAIDPYDRFDWFLENLLVALAVAALAATCRRFAFSDGSYTLLAIFLTLHAVGAHYTYSEVPLGYWIQDALGLGRNHFDRFVHFSFGLLLLYPLRELITRSAKVEGAWSYVLPLAACMAMSETYELIEWAAVQVIDPAAGLAFLGTQGDVFDAQKDTGLAALGALVTAIAIAVVRRTKGARGR